MEPNPRIHRKHTESFPIHSHFYFLTNREKTNNIFRSLFELVIVLLQPEISYSPLSETKDT